ncbi:MAG: sigma-70 family RNA polymerase sigma factor [Candidatus Pseudobacter hemicellulosilyticus]|uniref:Sigma-70 family RNA polymerase sigma factor n=1 Tax=Candidatus Pseudobacter hemicellulosilyticus TaxID=3121375 RepID=A0AAJ5WLV2_9BACT|nr:MAG: sigma-70 family RNA polymerase sigma factor [Pseudobacter sp.]
MQALTRKVLPDERSLLLLIAEGNEAAFRTVVIFYRPYLLSYILSFTHSRERSEETVQDVFLQVWRSRETLKEVHDLRSFIFVISRHLALNAVRSQLREEARKNKWLESQPEVLDNTEPVFTEDIPGILDQAVAQLPPQQQKAWILIRKEGQSYAEAATTMGISKETIKKYLQYATASMTAFITEKMKYGAVLVLSLLGIR